MISMARGTGFSGVSGIAVVFVARRTGVSGMFRVAGVSVVGRAGVAGFPKAALISRNRGTGVTGSPRVSRISIAGLRIGWVSRISVSRIPVSGISVAWVAIPVGWVAVIGARWRRRCSSDTPEDPGCPSDRRSKSGSRSATGCCSDRCTRRGSQYSSAKAALNGIIWVCAGREPEDRRRDDKVDYSPHSRSLSTLENRRCGEHRTLTASALGARRLAAVGLQNSPAGPVRDPDEMEENPVRVRDGPPAASEWLRTPRF